MFEIFKRRNVKVASLVAPISGKVVSLSEVEDPVFSQKMAGEGVAIKPIGDTIVSPVDGQLTLVFGTKHAFVVTTDEGIEILVHIGIDTVSLNGEGFEKIVGEGQRVQAGTPIIKINRSFIEGRRFSLITSVLITNPHITESIDRFENIECTAGQTTIIKYKNK